MKNDSRTGAQAVSYTPSLWTMRDFCAFLQISLRQGHRLKDAGACPAFFKMPGGRALRISSHVVEEWVVAGMPHCRETNWQPSTTRR